MSDFQFEKKIKTKKEHRCFLCERKILKGFTAHNVKGKYEGEFYNAYYCNTCNTLAKEFTEYVTDYDGMYSNWEFQEAMSWYNCSTPLQFLNALRKEYKK